MLSSIFSLSTQWTLYADDVKMFGESIKNESDNEI